MFIAQLIGTLVVVAIAIIVTITVGCDVSPVDNVGHPRLLVFTADWCATCRKARPLIEQMKHEGFLIDEYEVDADKSWMVSVLPTFIVMDGYTELYRTRHILRARSFLEDMNEPQVTPQ